MDFRLKAISYQVYDNYLNFYVIISNNINYILEPIVVIVITLKT